MSDNVLAGCRILVAEDEYLLARDTSRLLKTAGAAIIGPVATLEDVQRQVGLDGFDVAILDIRLNSELVYPAADRIQQAGIPIVFLTGYDDAIVPERFAGAPICQKPCPDEKLIEIVQRLCAV